MDPQCNEIKKAEGSDLATDPRPPPTKLARLEQHEMGPLTPERSRQGSPVAKNPCLTQKSTTTRLQGKSWHTKGTWAYVWKGLQNMHKGSYYLLIFQTLQTRSVVL